MAFCERKKIKSCNAKRRRQLERWKNNNRSSTLFCTFLWRCFARLQRETFRNFLASYTFYGGKVVPVLFTFFLLPLIFTLVAANMSHLLTAATKFSCCSSTKECLLCFLPLALATCLFLFFSVNFAGLSPTFSLFLSLSFSFSVFQDMTINLSLLL